jgi:putative oxidoreductase
VNTTSPAQSSSFETRPNVASRRAIIWPLLCLIVGAVFVYSGVMKVIDPVGFASDIENYKTVSWSVGMRLALYLPWLEIFCGIALIVGWLRAGAVAILTALMVIFIGITLVAKARGIDVGCGCFGAAGKNLGFTAHLAIDFAILAALIALWFRFARGADR